nr:MAG TPA: hypothetical protein [Caudoviricetes sp.]
MSGNGFHSCCVRHLVITFKLKSLEVEKLRSRLCEFNHLNRPLNS